MTDPYLPEFEPIEKKLEDLRESPERDPDLIGRQKAAFLARAESIAQDLPLKQPVSSPDGIRHTWWSNILQRKDSKKMSIVPTLLIVITLLFGGTGATVAAAQSAMPNDLLYPVKLVSEEIALTFSGSPDSKVKNELKLLERRSEELNQELAEDGDVGDEITDSLIDQLDETIESTDGLDRENQMAALLRIQAHMQLVLQEKIDRGQPQVAQENIQNLLDKVQARITALEEYMNTPDELKGKFNMGQWKDSVEKHDKNKNKNGEGSDTDLTPIPTLEGTLEPNVVVDPSNNGNGKGNGNKNKSKTPGQGND